MGYGFETLSKFQNLMVKAEFVTESNQSDLFALLIVAAHLKELYDRKLSLSFAGCNAKAESLGIGSIRYEYVVGPKIRIQCSFGQTPVIPLS